MNEKETNRNKKILLSIGLGILIVFLIHSFFFAKYIVEGESMMPTLQDGDHLIVTKFVLHIGDLDRFDIIVFRGKNDDYVKRVIGLPGDKLEYKDDVLLINDQVVEEPFLTPYKQKLIGGNLTGDFTLEEVTGKLVVPDGHIFVIGDNRLGSWDSRHYGFIELDQVVGRVDLKYWPYSKVELLF
jgi:signal peptidase I